MDAEVIAVIVDAHVSRTTALAGREESWNHLTRSAPSITTAIQLAFASKLEKKKRHSPESFSRAMWFSTCAWARMVRSSSAGSPS
jgi:hypothetical protein